MRAQLSIILIFFLFLISCKEAEKDQNVNDPVLEKIGGKNYAELIQIPTTPDGEVDTANMAIISFDQTIFYFDTIFQGQKVSHEFIFRNTGVKDLYILQTNSSCGCTVTDYKKDPIPPGELGKISAVFDSKGKKGKQNRKIAVISNAFPSENVLRMSGFVKLEE